MCLAVALLLLVMPVGGWALGYSRAGPYGGWAGALAGLAAALILAGAPLALIVAAQRKKLARERAQHPEHRLGD